MKLDVGTALSDGVSLALSRNGRLLMGAFLLAEAFNLLLFLVGGQLYLPVDPGRGLDGSSSQIPVGGELPLAATTVAIFASGLFGALLTTPLSIVAIRTFVDGATDRIADEYLFDRIGRATLSGVVVTLLTMGLFFSLPFFAGIGIFGVFVVLEGPTVLIVGLCLAIGVATVVVIVGCWLHFLFVVHEISVRDAGVLGALRGSWATARRSRLRLFGLAAVLALVRMSASWFGTPSMDGPLAVVELGTMALGLVASAIMGVVFTAVLARAYRQLSPDDAVRSASVTE